MHHLATEPTEVYVQICAKTQQVLSRKGYINAILALFHHVAGLAKAHPNELVEWRAHLAAEAATDKRYETNEPTERQKEAHIPWAKIEEKRDALDPDSPGYLLLCMYSLLPPTRGDFDRLAVYEQTPAPEQVEATPNYLLIHPAPKGKQSSKIKEQAGIRLTMNAFKTHNVSKGMGEYTHELPAELCTVIHRSLALNPRRFLFCQSRPRRPYVEEGGAQCQPFTTPSAYVSYADKLMQKVLEKPTASINMLRHSFASALPDRMRTGDKRAIAKLMCHSPSMNDAYRLWFDVEGEGLRHDVMGRPIKNAAK